MYKKPREEKDLLVNGGTFTTSTFMVAHTTKKVADVLITL